MAKIKIPKAKPIGVQHIELVLRSMNIKFVNEHVFTMERRFRFDIAIPEHKIAIEYEGLTESGFKGGHTTKTGYSKDCFKYNLAIVNGWRVLRFTALNYKDATQFLSVLFPNN